MNKKLFNHRVTREGLKRLDDDINFIFVVSYFSTILHNEYIKWYTHRGQTML